MCMQRSLISYWRREGSNTYQSMLREFVFAILTSHTKEIVVGVSCFSSRVFKIQSKPASSFRQPMKLVQSEPKFRSLGCSHPNRGRNQPSHPVSSGTLSTPHRLLFGHKTHQRLQHYQDRLGKHRLYVYRPCKLQHSSCKLKIAEWNNS